MSCDDTSALHHGGMRPTHYKSQCQCCPREKFDRDLKNDEVCFFASVIRCECVDEGHDQ